MSEDYRVRMSGDKNPNRKLHDKVCPVCGVTFKPSWIGRINCSKACADAAKRKRGKQPRRPVQLALGLIAKQYKLRRKQPHVIECGQCGKLFQSSPSCRRKFCSYQCFLDSGGPIRAGRAATVAKRLYGNKKDANHNEIKQAFEDRGAGVLDLSDIGSGVPDLLVWCHDAWHLVDVKNPETGYGKRGLNPLQQEWAENWKGGPVYLVYDESDVDAVVEGRFDDVKSQGGFKESVNLQELRKHGAI